MKSDMTLLEDIRDAGGGTLVGKDTDVFDRADVEWPETPSDLWWSLLIVVPFLVFVQIIGWTVYVHHVSPEIRWWTRRNWSQFKGQMESTTIMRFPRLVNRLWFHNIFIHVPHHVDARIAFHQLPAAAAAISDAYPGTIESQRFSVRKYLWATRTCKLYDFEAGRWLPYSAAGS